MKITILTLFPEMFAGFLNESIIKRAQEKNVVEIEVLNIRDFTSDAHRQVDDRPFGGGAGMVLMADPIIKALKKAKAHTKTDNKKAKTILMSARGTTYKQKKAQEFAQLEHLILVAGHYEAIDERIHSHIDEEISIGDYVLTGGELPVAVLIDSIVRLLPGVLKKQDATELESFFEVNVEELIREVGEDATLSALNEKEVEKVQLLEYPHYTRPQEYSGERVPEALLSGDPKKIRTWQLQEAYKKTKSIRPDLLQSEA